MRHQYLGLAKTSHQILFLSGALIRKCILNLNGYKKPVCLKSRFLAIQSNKISKKMHLNQRGQVAIMKHQSTNYDRSQQKYTGTGILKMFLWLVT
jgi:hypothetical protein